MSQKVDASTNTGIDPATIGTAIRVGQVGRENASTKARRLLVEGRVLIRRVLDGEVRALVRGDSGELREVVFERSQWFCSCPSRGGSCSHTLAVMSVTLIHSEGTWRNNGRSGG